MVLLYHEIPGQCSNSRSDREMCSLSLELCNCSQVVRVLRGQGDQWDNRARARAVTASFSLNGIGLVKEETTDLYQENEELKEEIQKLAGQIEFMKIVSMEVNNRHLKPKAGGYFCSSPAPDDRV